MAIEIVDFPIKNGGSFHSYVNVYQRVLASDKWIQTPGSGNPPDPPWNCGSSEGQSATPVPRRIVPGAKHLAEKRRQAVEQLGMGNGSGT
jgi:hypothetical protein